MLMCLFIYFCISSSVLIGISVCVKWHKDGMKDGWKFKDTVYTIIGCLGILIMIIFYGGGWMINTLIDHIMS